MWLEGSHPSLKDTGRGGCRLEVASAREHPTVYWRGVGPSTVFYRIGMDGAWGYHAFHQDLSELQSPASRK